jgi:hypothetical protein
MFSDIFLIFINHFEGDISRIIISLRVRKKTTDHRQRTTDMNKVLAILCFGALLFGACKRESKDEKFQREFQKFTQNECPVFVDRCTRLDSAVFDIPTHTLSYFYSVQDDLDNETIFENEDLTSTFRSDILKGLKGSIPLKPYKDEGIAFHYAYRSISTGKTLFELTFTEEDY